MNAKGKARTAGHAAETQTKGGRKDIGPVRRQQKEVAR